MSEKKKVYVFCRVKDENVILFTLSTLQKCEFILKCRKKYQLQFNDVILLQSKKEKTSNDVAKFKRIPGSFCKAWGLPWSYRQRYFRTNRSMSNVYSVRGERNVNLVRLSIFSKNFKVGRHLKSGLEYSFLVYFELLHFKLLYFILNYFILNYFILF